MYSLEIINALNEESDANQRSNELVPDVQLPTVNPTVGFIPTRETIREKAQNKRAALLASARKSEQWERGESKPEEEIDISCGHCGAGPPDAEGELPHFRNCQEA